MSTPVTIYTKPDCVNCDKTKKLFTILGVQYTTIDIFEDKTALAKVKAMGYREAPVVVAGDEHWGGFKEERIRSLAAGAAAVDDPWDE